MATERRHNQLTEKQKRWQHHVEQWSKSGISQAEYCRQNNLNVRCFHYFKSRLQQKNLPVQFVQVPVEPVSAPSILKLNTGSGFQVEIPDGFSQVTLAKVLQVIGGI